MSVYTQSDSGLRRAVGVGIDGVRVDRTILRDNLLAINVSNTLAEYGTPTGGRRLRVTVRCEAPCGKPGAVERSFSQGFDCRRTCFRFIHYSLNVLKACWIMEVLNKPADDASSFSITEVIRRRLVDFKADQPFLTMHWCYYPYASSIQKLGTNLK